MNLETKITIYKFTPQVFTLTQLNRELNQNLSYPVIGAQRKYLVGKF